MAEHRHMNQHAFHSLSFVFFSYNITREDTFISTVARFKSYQNIRVFWVLDWAGLGEKLENLNGYVSSGTICFCQVCA